MKTILVLFFGACVLGLALDAHESRVAGAKIKSKRLTHELRVRIV